MQYPGLPLTMQYVCDSLDGRMQGSCRPPSLPGESTFSLVHGTSTDLNYGTCHVKLSYVSKCLSCSPDSEPLGGRGCLNDLCDPNCHKGHAQQLSNECVNQCFLALRNVKRHFLT